LPSFSRCLAYGVMLRDRGASRGARAAPDGAGSPARGRPLRHSRRNARHRPSHGV